MCGHRDPVPPPSRVTLSEGFTRLVRSAKHGGNITFVSNLSVRAREHLGISIQTGGAHVGHSSLEDSVATLNLVRWYVLNKHKPKANSTAVASDT
jgi:hypothetical protein